MAKKAKIRIKDDSNGNPIYFDVLEWLWLPLSMLHERLPILYPEARL